MVVDRTILTRALSDFYDFRDKRVLYVGAGGGQLLDPSTRPAQVVAIDPAKGSLDSLRSEADTTWAGVPLRLLETEFERVDLGGDVTYFEFCLHEMRDPEKALSRAKALSADVVVMDHLPGSEWVYYGGEEANVLRSTMAVEAAGPRSQRRLVADQLFKDFSELSTRLEGRGEVSTRRVSALKGSAPIRIRMEYGLFLV